MILIRVLIFCTIFTTSLSQLCLGDTPKVTSLPLDLSVGAQWNYEAGSIIVRERVSKVEHKDGGVFISLERSNEKDRFKPYKVMKCTADAMYEVEYMGVALSKPECFLKFVVKEGDVWESGLGKFYVKKTEEIKVPAGTYKAMRIEREFSLPGPDKNNRVLKYVYWYTPGIGIVQCESDVMTMRLRSGLWRKVGDGLP